MDDFTTDLEPVTSNDIVMVEHDMSPAEQAKYMTEVAKY
ncbi:hypothetical protein LCGC14_2066670, partial [marine sediment metagenome]